MTPKVYPYQEVEDFEHWEGWRRFYMVFFGMPLCRHKYWVSAGWGPYCYRCLKRVELITDKEDNG